MAIFRPPIVGQVPATMDGSSDNGYVKFQRKNIDRGGNVFLHIDGSVDTNQGNWTSVSKTFYGGHANVIDGPDIVTLTNAGYGAYITPT